MLQQRYIFCRQCRTRQFAARETSSCRLEAGHRTLVVPKRVHWHRRRLSKKLKRILKSLDNVGVYQYVSYVLLELLIYSQ